jgi:hypothetical protein
MTEQVKTEEQLRTEAVFLLIQVRLVAAQNLLRSLREEHKAGCKQIEFGFGGAVDLDGITSRIRETENRILAMQPLLKLAASRMKACDEQIDTPEGQIPEIKVSSGTEDANLEMARGDYWRAGQAEPRCDALGVS